ncbi:MAG: Crp/Fnr family transcriptional regulator [candidate division Zixibacteria bacterium]|nr:Crp/Fnr family transcriptional regulator [candidate division Zixibacteria bacterium]
MKASALKHVPLFSSLENDELETIAAGASIHRVKAETTVLRVDQTGDSLFVILSGRVSVSMHSDEGREVILSILTDGDFFGEMALLDGYPRSATVVTTEPTELLELRRYDFLQCLARYPQIATRMLSTLAHRIRRTNRQVENLALLNAYGRVAAVLFQLAEDQVGDGLDVARITILERPMLKEIAHMAGTTRETVSRIMNNLEKDGYIERKGRKITIIYTDRLYDDFFLHP